MIDYICIQIVGLHKYEGLKIAFEGWYIFGVSNIIKQSIKHSSKFKTSIDKDHPRHKRLN